MKRLFALIYALPIIASAQATNPAVTQDKIHKTICVSGWTKTVRPPVSVTNKIKFRMMEDAGIPLINAHLIELDHIISLEVGGHPSDPENLRLQLWEPELSPEQSSWDIDTGAHLKDVVETRMKRYVCAGKIDLRTAQICLFFNWRACPL